MLSVFLHEDCGFHPLISRVERLLIEQVEDRIVNLMDLIQPPHRGFPSICEIQIVCRAKAKIRDTIVRTFGEEFIQRILESPRLVFIPIVRN